MARNANRYYHPLRPIWELTIFACLVLATATLAILPLTQTAAFAQTALDADTRDALARLKNRKATQADRAILFANNDAIQAAGQNGSISQSDYLKAQNDYSALNESFGKAAAEDAGAAFKVQAPSSSNPVPGTDSDYITTVESKNQIPEMQESYNKRVNEFLENIPEEKRPKARTDWHNKLDVDFMADPASITDPDEFREIAKMNNDAYKNRYAAEYEALSRAGDGTRIGPEHVNGYMEEMNEFAQKKGRKVDKILSEPPSHLSDPKNRAELFQAMAQEQKYTSRMESLDDFLRAQEGLPPRNRGTTMSKLGSNRSASNSANVRNANAVADSSRFAALEDLAETMSEVSRKNPHFNVNAVDDIAKIVEGLPPGRRASALSRISRSAGPGMVDDIIRASGKAGRLPPGAGSLADDLLRINSDDLGRLISNTDDLSDVSRARKVMSSAMDTLDAIGKVATGAEAALAIYQMREIFQLREQLLDPDLSDAERARLAAKEAELTRNLAESVGLTIITELSPHVAIAYGAWTVGCMAGEYRSATREGSNQTCGDRQLAAVDRAIDQLSGKQAEDELHVRRLCNKFKTAVREKRVRLRPGYSEEEVCGYIARGNTIVGTFEHIPEEERAALLAPKPDRPTLVPASCDSAANSSVIASLSEASNSGHPEALAHVAMLRSVNAQIANARASAKQAQQAFAEGKIVVARSSLNTAKASIDSLSGKADCTDLSDRIAANLGKVDQLDTILGSTADAIAGCSPAALRGARETFAGVNHPLMATYMGQIDSMMAANAQVQDAKASYSAGSLSQATNELRSAEAALQGVPSGSCSALRQQIAGGLTKIDTLRNAISTGEQAIARCDTKLMGRIRAALAKIVNPAAGAVKAQLEQGDKICEERARHEKVADLQKRCVASFGEYALADAKTVGTGNPLCICQPGYQLNEGPTSCVKTPSKNDLAAERRANCRKKFGSGYFPGPVDAKGVYFCRPSKKTAQAECRKQAKQNNKVYAYTNYKNGEYNCFWCDPGFRFSKGQCRSANQKVVRTCPGGYQLKGDKCYPRNTGQSGGGQLYSCTYYNPDGSILGGGGSYSTIQSPAPIRGANCRRIR